MNIEELQQDPEFLEFITKQIGTATDGLVTKNAELLDELKKAKSKAGKFDEDEIEDLKAKAARLADIETKADEEAGNFAEVKTKMREQHAAELSTMQESLDKQTVTVRKLLVDGGLTAALAEAKVNPVLLPAATSLLASEVSVIEEDGAMVARVGDKSIADFVKDWSGGEVGKNFVLIDGSGGGSKPSTSTSTVGDADSFFDPSSPNHNVTRQYELRQADPEKAEALTKKYAGVSAAPNQGQVHPQHQTMKI